jgi:transforming growth factor-beta-induced protein
MATTGGAAAGGSTSTGKSIVEIATSTAEFSVLAAAVTKAGLVDALGGQNLTVFTPTNAAFPAMLTAIG